MPIVAADIAERLPRLLRLWSDRRFVPATGPLSGSGPRLVIVVNRASPEEIGRIMVMVRGFPVIARCFAGVEVVSAGLEGARDLYVRGQGALAGPFGNKAGPNFLFAASMKAALPHGGFTFLTELDCLPTGPDWLAALERIAAQNARAWVIGSIYSGPRRLGKIVQDHLNGNALYKAGDPLFQDFLDSEWMPGLLSDISAGHPNLAYDCWWAVERWRADPETGNPSWERVRRYDGFFRNDPFLLNFLGRGDDMRAARAWMETMAAVGRPPLFVHGPAMGEVADLLLAAPDLRLSDALDMLSVTAPPRPAAGLDDLAGGVLIVALCGRLLLDPGPTLALIAADRVLAARLAAALADPGLPPALAARWRQLCDRAASGA